MTPVDLDAQYLKEVGPVWNELRGRLWHSTPIRRFASIIKARAIEPSPGLPDGDLTWGATLSRALGAVSLFDFRQEEWAKILRIWEGSGTARRANIEPWSDFLSEGSPNKDWSPTVWFKFDQKQLPGFLPLTEMREAYLNGLEGEQRHKYMSVLEAGHRGPISLDLCQSVIVICPTTVGEYQYEILPLHPLDEASARAAAIDYAWRDKFAEESEVNSMSSGERLFRGDFSLS